MTRYRDDVQRLWKATLRFEDSQGTQRWHRCVHHRRAAVGSRHWIRYDPRRPGRKSTLFVDWQQR
ncbi:hypothetical protein [Gordonia sp. VNK21]|uniref:hypothetical protein n=1 Tax=Gordonia sp. VNK21 TaxID=3382483 RepID=UPI0038D48FE4